MRNATDFFVEQLENRILLAGTPVNVLVNNMAEDTTSEDTQSETSTVAFGNTVLVAFNDSGSNAINSSKFTGWSRSTDGGATFTDLGTLPTNTNGDAGDPVLARDNTTGSVYLATLSLGASNVIQVFKSTDGGATFGLPVNGDPGFTGGQLDKEWMTVDNYAGAGQGNVYLLVRDFGTNNGILFTKSTDHGATFGPNNGTMIVSGGAGNVQGAWVTVGPDHTVYAFWYDATTSPQRIMMRKSTDQGTTWTSAVTVANLTTTGTNGDFGLGFRTDAFPQAVVNPNNPNNIYVTYTDKGTGTDRCNIYFTQSSNGGTSWTVPVKVNDDATTRDQWQPAMSIKPDGSQLFIGFYDRRDDAANSLINTYGAVGDISGSNVTFEPNFRISDTSFPAVYGVDPVINPTYMGDYDSTSAASDNANFYYSWADNRDNSLGRAGKQANVRFAKISLGMQVSSTTPGANSIVTTTPTDFTVGFSGAYLASSVDASDFTVNGIPASSFTLVDASTVSFHFNSSPVTSQGLQTMAMAASAILRQSDNSPLIAFNANFRYDAVPLTVVSTSPANGSLTALPLTVVDFNFSEAIDPTSVQITDLVLNQGTVTGFSVVNPTTVHFTLSGINTEGTLTLNIAAGAINDAFGNPGQSYSGSLALDVGTVPFPTPLSGVNPQGSLIYDPVATGTVGVAGDVDNFTLNLDAGQTLTVVATSASTLRSTISLLSPSSVLLASTTAPAAGKDAVIQTVPITTAGIYTISITGSSGTIGAYTIQSNLNAAAEMEQHAGPTDDTLATAQDLSSSFISLGGGGSRGAVIGSTSTATTGTFYSTDFESGAAGFVINNTGGGLWHLSTGRGSQTGHSATTSFYYGQGEGPNGGGNYSTGAANTGTITSPAVTLPVSSNISLDFNYVLQTEGSPSWDLSQVQISTNGGASFTTLASYNGVAESTVWKAATTISLAAYSGQTVQLRWYFNTIDSVGNNFEGWYVDDVRITAPVTQNDYYAFSLAPGDSVTLGAKTLTSGAINLSLLDSNGNTVASSLTTATNLDRVISDYVSASGGTYYALVSGAGPDYSLVVTRDADFDTETNDTRATAQPIKATAVGGNQRVLGNLGGTTTGIVDFSKFDEPQPLDGVSVNGITFGYTLDGAESDDALIGGVENDPNTHLSGSILSGNAEGILSMDFDQPTSHFSFDVSLTSEEANPNADSIGDEDEVATAIVNLFNTSGDLIQAMQIRGLNEHALGIATRNMSYDGEPISHAEISFVGADDFEIGNLSLAASGNTVDTYSITAAAGKTLNVQTFTPGDGPGEFVNTFNPRLRLLDSLGNQLALDDNSAPDGRNAFLSYVVGTTGTYYIEVSSTTTATTMGDYILSVGGPAISLSLPSDVNESGGTVTGTLKVSPAPASDLLVTLTSSDSARLGVPATLTIPAGQTSVPLPLNVIDNSVLDGLEAITIGASAAGYATVSGNVNVHDDESAMLTVNLPASATEGVGTVVGTITSSAAPTRDITVALTSSNTSRAIVPATITLKAGQTSANFNLSILDNTIIDGTQPVTVTAAVENWTSGSAVINVQDNDNYLVVTVPTSGWEGQTLSNAGTIQLGGTSASPITVNLLSLNTSKLTVPATVIIPAGQTSATFTLTLPSNSLKDGNLTESLTASASGLTGGGANILVHDATLDHLSIDPISSPKTVAVPFSATARAFNIANETIVVYGGAATLSATGQGGSLPISPTSATFSSGIWSGNVTISAIDPTVTLKADAGGGAVGASNVFATQAGPVASFQWSTISSPQNQVPFPVTLTATDANGFPATNFNGSITLTGLSGTGGSPITSVLLYQESNKHYFQSALTALGLNFTTYTTEAAFDTALSAANPTTTLAIVDESANNVTLSPVPTFVNSGGRVILEYWNLSTAPSLASAFGATVFSSFTTPLPVYNWGGSNLFNGVSSPIGFAETSWITDGQQLQPLAGASAVAGFQSSVTANQAATIIANSGRTILNGFLLDDAVTPAAVIQFASNEIQALAGSSGASIAITPTSATFINGVWSGNVTVLQAATGMHLHADDGSGHLGDSNNFNVTGPAAPSAPDLLDATDSGASSTDNNTNFNNATPAKALQFAVVGTVVGATVGIYADGVLVGSAVATSSTTLVTTSGALTIADGVHNFTARQTVAGQGQSMDSSALSVTIDTIAPTTPVAPDLQDASDSGVSITDNITSVKTPTFTVASAPYFRFFRNGIQLSSDYQSGTIYTLASQADGTYSYTIQAVDAAGNVSPTSSALSVTIDTVAPQIISSSIQGGAVLPASGNFTYSATFSEPIPSTNLDSTDFALLGISKNVTYTPVSFAYSTGNTVLTLSYNNLPEDNYTLTLLSGDTRFEDTAGNDLDGEANFPIPPNHSGNGVAGGNFVINFSTDIATTAYPTPLTPVAPTGSLIYDPAVSGVIGPAGDTDTFTLAIDPGQTLTLFASASAGLQPTLNVLDPTSAIIASAASPGANIDALIQTISITTPGTYSFVVGGVGASTGQYTLQAVLNAAVENDAHGGASNSTFATAQSLDSAFLTLSGNATRSALLGRLNASDDWYKFTLSPGDSSTMTLNALAGGNVSLELRDSANNLLALGSSGATNVTQSISDFVSPTGGMYYLHVTGTLNTDYTIVATRNAAFDLEGNDTLATSENIDGQHVVLGALSGGAVNAGAVKMGLIQDQGSWGNTTVDTTVATGLGYTVTTINSSTLATVNLSNFNMIVLAGDQNSTTYSNVQSNLARIQSWVAMGGVWVVNDAASNISLPYGYSLLPGASGITFSAVGGSDINVLAPTSLLVNGPGGVITNTTLDGGNSSDHGYTTSALPAGAISDLSTAIASQIVAFDYPDGLGHVVVHTVPIEFYGGTGNFGIFHKNLYNFGASFIAAANDDYYSFNLSAGQSIQISTSTPADGPNQFVNTLNPALDLFDPSGTKVATNDNGAPDGRNALVNYTAATTGTFKIRIYGNGTSGEYVLNLTAPSAPLPAFTVSSSSIANGATLVVPPTQVTLGFNAPILLSSLQASDLTLDGTPLSSFTLVDSKTVTFNLPTLPNGPHTFSIAAGSISNLQAIPVQLFSSSFVLNYTPPRVTSSSIQENAVLSPGSLTYTATFNKPMNKTNLDASDFTLKGIYKNVFYSASSFAYDAAGTTLTLTYTGLPEDGYTLTLISGATNFQDTTGLNLDGEPVWPCPPNMSGDGVVGGNFFVDFSMDNPTAAYPTPLVSVAPAGSLIYDPTVSGVIGTVGDTDSFTLPLDPGQTLSLVATPGSTLRPTIQLRDPSNNLIGTATASSNGLAALLQTVPITVSGTYSITVSGAASTAGTYTLAATLNAAIESETTPGGATDNTRANAQNIDASFITLASNGKRGAVLGTTDLTPGVGADYYSFTASAGDKIFVGYRTLTGTAIPTINLQNSSGAILASAVSGPTNLDRVISSFTISTTGTYFVFLDGTTSSTSTYSLLVNRNAAFDQESNDTLATAQSIQATHVVVGAIAGGGGVSTLTLTSLNNGWWDSTGAHTASNLNYFVGMLTNEHRDYFVFNLAGITQPITAAQLNIFNPSTGFVSSDPTETLAFFDVSTPIATLEANGSGLTTVFNDLGAGTNFGSRTVSASDNGQTVSLALNSSALAALNAAIGTQFAIGGAITTISGTAQQNIFGFTSGSETPRTLVLTLGSPVNDDYYSFTLAAGETVQLSTKTPADGPNQFVNTLDPAIDLFDPSGAKVATNDNGGPDGRNALLSFTAITGGTYKVRVYAAGTTSGEYVLNLNRSPKANNDSPSALEDTSITFSPSSNDTDSDNDPLTVASITQPSHGSAVLNLNNTVTYTPAANYNGLDAFTYVVSDGNGGTSTGTVNLTVTAVNDPPSFTKGADQTVLEDAGPQTVASWATNISAGPPNESTQLLNFLVSNDNNGLFAVQPSIAPDGTLSYTPYPNASGSATVTVQLHDNGGTDNGGVDTSAPQTFNITVIAVADPPALSVSPASGYEGTSIPLSISAALTDTEGSETLSLQIANVPANATLSAGANIGGGIWNLTPAQLAGLTITCPDNAAFNLFVIATSTESSNGSQAQTTASLPVTVLNAPPQPMLAGPPTSYPVATTVFYLSASDVIPDNLAGFTFHIDWGDGSDPKTIPASPGNGMLPFQCPHVYTADGTFTVSLTATDKDGGTSAPVYKTINIIGAYAIAAIGDDPADSTKTALFISGTSGNDHITLDQDNGLIIPTVNGDKLNPPNGYLPVSGRIYILAFDGNDNVTVNNDVTGDFVIVGGAGDDTIADSGLGNDILIGGDGNDQLSAAGGRDLLIGGNGADKLNAGAADDILLGSASAYDSNYVALSAIMKEWTSGNNYNDRVGHLAGTQLGGFNGSTLIRAGFETVDDLCIDTLTGGTGQDLFYAATSGPTKDLTDLSAGETLFAL